MLLKTWKKHNHDYPTRGSTQARRGGIIPRRREWKHTISARWIPAKDKHITMTQPAATSASVCVLQKFQHSHFASASTRSAHFSAFLHSLLPLPRFIVEVLLLLPKYVSVPALGEFRFIRPLLLNFLSRRRLHFLFRPQLLSTRTPPNENYNRTHG